MASSVFSLVGNEVCARGGKASLGTRTLLCATDSGNHTPLQVVANNHLLQLHNVGMAETQEQCDLTQAADRNACNHRCSVNSPGHHTFCPPVRDNYSDTNTAFALAFIYGYKASGRGYWRMWRVTVTSPEDGAKGFGENVQFYSWPR